MAVHKSFSLAVFTLSMSMLSGCDTLSVDNSSTDPAATADARLTHSNEAKFFSQSGLQACAGGAVVGVITCKLTNTCDSDKGVLTAAVVGCGIGMGTNYYLEQRRTEYSNEEKRLDVMIADVQADNRKLASLTTTAESVLSQDKQKLVLLQQQVADKTVEKQQAEKTLAQVDANTRYLNTSLIDLRKRELQWQDVVRQERQQKANTQDLQQEVDKMQKQIISLQEDVSEVEAQRRSIILG